MVAALGLFLWVEGPPKPEIPENGPNLLGEPKLRDPSKFVPLIAFDAAAVTRIHIRHGGNELTAERESEGWKTSRPSASLDSFLRNLGDLGRIIEIPANAEALKDYGLDQPKSVVELTMSAGKAPVLLELGNQNPAATGVYTRVDRAGPIILAGALATWELDKLFRVPADQAA